MSSDTEAPVDIDARPHVHLWMTTHEAAEILDVSVGVIERKKDSGELESRVVEDGTQEVLICLPERPAVPVDAALAPMIDALADIERKLAPPAAPPTLPVRHQARPVVPPAHDVRWTRAQDVRKARRSARVAWAAAMLVMGAAGAAAFILRQSDVSRQQIEVMADEVQRISQANAKLSAQKTQLDADLAEARQNAQKAQGELVVERSIEDTLLKAAIRNHAAIQASSTAMVEETH